MRKAVISNARTVSVRELHTKEKIPNPAPRNGNGLNGYFAPLLENLLNGFQITPAQKAENQGGSLAYSKKLPKPKTIYVIDCFCGCGGMSWGFATTRQSHMAFQVVAGIDIDSTALATYKRNLPSSRAIQQDIWNLARKTGQPGVFVPPTMLVLSSQAGRFRERVAGPRDCYADGSCCNESSNVPS